MTTLDLFDALEQSDRRQQPLGRNAYALRGFALPYMAQLLPALAAIERAAPFRNMVTARGFRMSVAMTNCGALGWTSDRRGYRYMDMDPDTNRPWPPMPGIFLQLATEAAATAGFPDFLPDACLINRYPPASKLSLHQDKNERGLQAPIVSVSLGMPAMFLWGGNARADRTERIPLLHGDVVVWGGVDRLRYHGIVQLKEVPHPLFGANRINLTFRRAG